MNEDLQEIENIKKKLQEHLTSTVGDGKKVSDIDQLQKYVSAEYD